MMNSQKHIPFTSCIKNFDISDFLTFDYSLDNYLDFIENLNILFMSSTNSTKHFIYKTCVL